MYFPEAAFEAVFEAVGAGDVLEDLVGVADDPLVLDPVDVVVVPVVVAVTVSPMKF